MSAPQKMRLPIEAYALKSFENVFENYQINLVYTTTEFGTLWYKKQVKKN